MDRPISRRRLRPAARDAPDARTRSDRATSGSAPSDGSPTEAAIEERARSYLLAALSASDRSSAQLRQGLAERGCPPEIADRLLRRFAEVGLVDDAQYARSLVRSQREGRQLARRGLRAELERRGVAAAHIDQALASIDDVDEETAARAVVRRRLAGMDGLDAQRMRRRLLGVLGRKGYSPSMSIRLINEELHTRGIDRENDADWDQVVGD